MLYAWWQGLKLKKAVDILLGYTHLVARSLQATWVLSVWRQQEPTSQWVPSTLSQVHRQRRGQGTQTFLMSWVIFKTSTWGRSRVLVSALQLYPTLLLVLFHLRAPWSQWNGSDFPWGVAKSGVRLVAGWQPHWEQLGSQPPSPGAAASLCGPAHRHLGSVTSSTESENHFGWKDP